MLSFAHEQDYLARMDVSVGAGIAHNLVTGMWKTNAGRKSSTRFSALKGVPLLTCLYVHLFGWWEGQPKGALLPLTRSMM